MTTLISMPDNFSMEPIKESQTSEAAQTTTSHQLLSLLGLLGWSYWPVNLVTFIPALVHSSSVDISNPQRIFWPFVSTCLASSISRIFLGFYFSKDPNSNHPVALMLKTKQLRLSFLNLIAGLLILTWAVGFLYFDTAFTALSIALIALQILSPIFFRSKVVWDCFADTLSLCLKVEIAQVAISMALPFNIQAAISLGFLGWALLQLFVLRLKDPITPQAIYDYHQEDFVIYLCAGLASMFGVVIMGLAAINSMDLKVIYREPRFLLVALISYFLWKMRLWIFANRGIIDPDPVSFCLKDPFTYLAWVMVLIGNYLSL